MPSPAFPSFGPLPTAMVTGASSGLGHALALQWARGGGRVVAVGRDAQRLQALAASQPGIDPVVADLREAAALAALVRDVLARHPDLACLVNNAGIQHDCRMDDAGYGPQALEDEVVTNLLAPLQLTQALLPHLLRQDAAWIVNIGSVLALAPRPTAAAYSATKAGLHRFHAALRLQLRGTQVAVVEVLPPLVDTPMTAGRGSAKMAPEAAAQALLRGLRQGRSIVAIGKARAAWALHRCSPQLLEWLMGSGRAG